MPPTDLMNNMQFPVKSMENPKWHISLYSFKVREKTMPLNTDVNKSVIKLRLEQVCIIF